MSSADPAALAEVSNLDLLAEVARRYPPRVGKFYPPEFFAFLNHYRPAVTFEAVVWRRVGDQVQLLMRDRGPAEAYPFTVHIPGSYMLLDESAMEVLQRILSREVGPGARILTVSYAGPLYDRYEARGPQVHDIWVLNVDVEPTDPAVHWMSVEQALALPNLIDHHRDFLTALALPVILGTHPPGLWKEHEPS